MNVNDNDNNNNSLSKIISLIQIIIITINYQYYYNNLGDLLLRERPLDEGVGDGRAAGLRQRLGRLPLGQRGLRANDYIMLYYDTSYHIMLYCIVLYDIVLCYMTLYYIIE